MAVSILGEMGTILKRSCLETLHEEDDGEPRVVEETSYELGDESALEDDSFVEFLLEESDAEAEPVESVVLRTNARGASSASNGRGGEPLQEKPGHNNLSWLCGVCGAPEFDFVSHRCANQCRAFCFCR